LDVKIDATICRRAEIHFLLQRFEPKHLDNHAPVSWCDGIKAIMSIAVGHRSERLAVLRKRYGRTWNWLTRRPHKATLRRQAASHTHHQRNQFRQCAPHLCPFLLRNDAEQASQVTRPKVFVDIVNNRRAPISV
jgi:hypothetical protein